DVEGIAQYQEADDFFAGVRVDGAALGHGVAGDDADALAVQAGERGHDGFAKARLQFENAVLVVDQLQNLAYVVDLGARLGQDVEDFFDFLTRTRRNRVHGGRFEVVAGQVGQEALDGFQ